MSSGPNGSGKSNLSDAILWATGSLSPHELRAEKPDDVLFAGSSGRQPTDFCEVELVFDNEDGGFGPSCRSPRSRSRGGCTAAARGSTSSTGRRSAASTWSSCSPTSGSAAGCARSSRRAASSRCSASKPAERRELVEEAAGLGPLQAPPPPRGAEARARRDAGRARARPRGRGAQAPAPARAPGDRGRARREARRRDRVGSVHAIATLDLARLAARRADADARRTRGGARSDSGSTQSSTGSLASALVPRRSSPTRPAAREAATAALYRLRGGAERVALRREAAATRPGPPAGAISRRRAHSIPARFRGARGGGARDGGGGAGRSGGAGAAPGRGGGAVGAGRSRGTTGTGRARGGSRSARRRARAARGRPDGRPPRDAARAAGRGRAR